MADAPRTYVLDTNVLLDDPLAYTRFQEHRVIIPMSVVQEIDTKKKDPTEIGKHARSFVRSTLGLTFEQESTGDTYRAFASLDHGGIVCFEDFASEAINSPFDIQNTDDKILYHAYHHPKEAQRILVTMDGALTIKAKTYDIPVETYQHDRKVKKTDELHGGIHRVYAVEDVVNDIHKGVGATLYDIEGIDDISWEAGDALIIKSCHNPSHSVLGRIQYNKKIGDAWVYPLQHAEDGYHKVKPRNAEQKILMDLLRDDSIDMVFVLGGSGTGKTLMTLAAGLTMTEASGAGAVGRRFERMLAARPLVAAGNDIGYLPGDMDEKLSPWMRPMYDNLEILMETRMGELEKSTALQERLEFQALSHIRGRSLPQQFIIIDEAQNTTKEEIKTIVTRAGEGAKMVIMGDPSQVDSPFLDEINNGLVYACERMKHFENVGVIRMDKTERSRLADQAVQVL